MLIFRNGCRSEGAAGGGGRGPGPLEIEAAEVARNVNDFTDEEEPGNSARFHGFAGKFAGVNATGGDFRFVVALVARRSDGPGVSLQFQGVESGIGEGFWLVEFQPAPG